MGLYAASKHALEGASEALYHELKPWNIHVTLLQPGFVSLPSYEKVCLGLVLGAKPPSTSTLYAAQGRMIEALTENALKLTTTTPRDVAEAVWKLTLQKHPPLRQKVTLDAQVFGFLKRFLPERAFMWLVHFCLYRIQRSSEFNATAQLNTRFIY